MTAEGYTLFDTPVGRCALAWNAQGVVGVQLPFAREAALRARMTERFPHACEAPPPPAAQVARDAIVALLSGETCELASIALDLRAVSPFYRRVYEVARAIPPGQTRSYGEIARALGAPGSARAVGQALGRNPFPIIVPCHRVLAAGGRAGGFSADGGIVTKLRLLALERARTDAAGPRFDGDGDFAFNPEVALCHLRAADPVMARLIDTVGPFRMRLHTSPTLFVELAQAIAYQQLTGRAAATIFARVRALFPNPHEGPTPEQVLRVSDEKLRSAGLSRAKILSLRDLAAKAASGVLPQLHEAQRLDDEAIVERLTQVRGIGRWTAEMLLMFRLGRPDVLPVDDYGIRKGFAAAFRKRTLPERKQLEARAAPWRPYRSVASWYLWRAAEQAQSEATGG